MKQINKERKKKEKEGMGRRRKKKRKEKKKEKEGFLIRLIRLAYMHIVFQYHVFVTSPNYAECRQWM